MNTNTWREARIYLPLEKGSAIVAPVYCNMCSLNYEQENPIVVAEWRDPIALASAFRKAIERFARLDRNLRDYKSTDWPTYQASGCRSVRQFESSFQAIYIKAVNEAELYYKARTKPDGEEEIELRVLLNRHGLDVEIGRKVLRLFDVCSKWSEYA
jgi:hypothetical protein